MKPLLALAFLLFAAVAPTVQADEKPYNETGKRQG